MGKKRYKKTDNDIGNDETPRWMSFYDVFVDLFIIALPMISGLKTKHNI